MPSATGKESKRPANSKFKQQNLPAWKPILTPRTVLPTFFVIGVVFIAVGIPLFLASDSVKELDFDYTECTNSADDKCADVLESTGAPLPNSTDRCTCNIVRQVSGFEGEDVFLYYALENYYQNHRRYVKSRSDPQLRSSVDAGGEDCDPLNDAPGGKFYAPCGLIANSLFNDTIRMHRCTDGVTCATSTLVTLTGSGISWRSDRETKFKNPDAFSTEAEKPPNWPVPVTDLGTTGGATYNPWDSVTFNSNGEAYENEDFINWMRTAALPNFRKLWRKVVSQLEDDAFYRFEIQYNYPVKVFNGKKRIVLSTTSWLGGENPFLGIIYLVVGCLCIVAGIMFLIFQQTKGRDLGDTKFLKWED